MGFCKIKKSELIKFGFSETQAREGRRDEIIRQLKIRGIRIFDVDYRKNGRVSSASYLVKNINISNTFYMNILTVLASSCILMSKHLENHLIQLNLI